MCVTWSEIVKIKTVCRMSNVECHRHNKTSINAKLMCSIEFICYSCWSICNSYVFLFLLARLFVRSFVLFYMSVLSLCMFEQSTFLLLSASCMLNTSRKSVEFFFCSLARIFITSRICRYLFSKYHFSCRSHREQFVLLLI